MFDSQMDNVLAVIIMLNMGIRSVVSEQISDDIFYCTNANRGEDLDCSESKIVTGRLLIGFSPTPEDIFFPRCAYLDGDCLISASNINDDISDDNYLQKLEKMRREISNCFWKASRCNVAVSPFAGFRISDFSQCPDASPTWKNNANIFYGMVENFQCISESSIHDVCSTSVLPPVAHGESQFLVSPAAYTTSSSMSPGTSCVTRLVTTSQTVIETVETDFAKSAQACGEDTDRIEIRWNNGNDKQVVCRGDEFYQEFSEGEHIEVAFYAVGSGLNNYTISGFSLKFTGIMSEPTTTELPEITITETTADPPTTTTPEMPESSTAFETSSSSTPEMPASSLAAKESTTGPSTTDGRNASTFTSSVTTSHGSLSTDKGSSKHKHLPIILGISIGAVVLLVLLVFIFVCYQRRGRSSTYKIPS